MLLCTVYVCIYLFIKSLAPQKRDERPFSSKDDGCMPSLSYTQRMYGFGACFVLGGLMSFLSSFSLIHGDIPQFAVLYCWATSLPRCPLGSPGGQRRSVRRCEGDARHCHGRVPHLHRSYLVVTVFLEETLEHCAKTGICITLIIVQFIALCWYCLSICRTPAVWSRTALGSSERRVGWVVGGGRCG